MAINIYPDGSVIEVISDIAAIQEQVNNPTIHPMFLIGGN